MSGSPRPFTRRTALKTTFAAGLGLAAGGLAACGSSGGGAAGAASGAAPKVKPVADGDLTWFTWEGYVDPKVVKAFEKEHGVKVKLTFFDSDDLMVQKLATGLPYDLITTNSAYNKRLIAGGLVQPFDFAQLKNSGEIVSYFQAPPYDRAEHRYSIPYGYGPAGILYRSDKVTSAAGSWSDLWNAPEAKGKIYVIGQVDETIGLSLIRNGDSVVSGDGGQVTKAVDELLKLKPSLGGISADIEGDIGGGNSWMSHAWTGSAFRAIQASKQPENLKFEFPKEGICMGCDTLSIGAKAKSPGTALLFMDWILKPENSSKNVTYTGYPNGTTSGDQAYGDLIKDYPFLDLGADVLANAKWKESATGARLSLWNQQWSRFKA
ncbi:MAG TPA: spermidine/putrescine ABC transporter substrate-binding protein [Baekduia sp.]|uniref:polyamine ABC transporter substrate-binding protein n=1 Tax=Baekduia sp. TaxID=2600305 RepID=UPI002D7A2D1D|nr:spermidine/putrescine ABC transporter substrate-binding protein [Baekduia sp.]HET6507351.1 spermidine/putrescine ABC transporter substrate-binding protein [Baekduia sp.]